MTKDDLIGKQLGEYHLEALLGRGGMARVYRAVDTRLKRYVVVKVIDPPLRSDPEYMMRFEREAQAIARLDHPNIIRLYRFDKQDGWLYMAMQHVEGADLEVVLAGHRADKDFMAPDDIQRIIGQIGSALDYAHDRGVIHRDVKPANILLDQQGHAVLSDFGLALLTEVGTRGEIFGSAHYMAPEQAISSARAVPQSDLYALGVILYEMFTGDVPFKAAAPLDIALLHMSEPPQSPRKLRPDIDPELEAVILKALAKKPEERYPTGAALSDALDRSLKNHSAVAAPPPVDEPTPSDKPIASPAGRRSLLYTGAISLVIILSLALLCSGLTALPSLMNRFNQRANVPADQSPMTVAVQPVASQIEPPVTLSVIRTKTPSPAVILSPRVSSTLPSPTGTPVSYELLIIRGSDNDSVIVFNRSAGVFPLELLRLGDEQKGLRGTEWGVDSLEKGECVGVWKKNEGKGKNKLPNGVNCHLIGDLLVREKKDWFGERAFAVFYDDRQFGVCDKDRSLCLIEIVP